MIVRDAWAATLLCAVGVASAVQGASEHRLWDEAHLLSPRERSDLERRLQKARTRLGSPVFVLITDRLRHETAAEMAERVFAERIMEHGSGGPQSNPVLLVVAVHNHAAAIATGKGNAGIVPEMDAARISRNLVSPNPHRTFKEKLARAVDAIVESAEATAARRRPLSGQDEDLPPADAQPGGAAAPLPSAEAPPTSDHATPKPQTDGGSPTTGLDRAARDRVPKGIGPSRVPLAVGVSVLLVLGLALRRRRQIAATRPDLKFGDRAGKRREGPSSSRPPRRSPP